MMHVLTRSEKGYAQDPTKYFKFARFADQGPKIVLVEGAFEGSDEWSQFNLSQDDLAAICSKPIVRLEFEEPNKFFIGDRMQQYDAQFGKIFTLCPYTAAWLNDEYESSLRTPIFFPFNEDYIPEPMNKVFDIIYTGHLVSRTLVSELKQLTTFNFALVSNSNHRLVTHKSANYERKLQLIAQSKITLVHNTLYPKARHIRQIKRYPNWQRNFAFREIAAKKSLWGLSLRQLLVPQLKSRAFEAAFSRSLILCKRDNFNVINQYFEPDRDFVFYDGCLRSTVNSILRNFDQYADIVDSAHEKAMSLYTTKAFFEKHLRDLEPDALRPNLV